MENTTTTVDEVATDITGQIMREIRSVRFQNAQLREEMVKAGLTPPSEDANYESLVKAIETAQAKEDSIEGKEDTFKAAVYRDAANYCLAAKRRGDIRWNEACEHIRNDLLGVAAEHDPLPPKDPSGEEGEVA